MPMPQQDATARWAVREILPMTWVGRHDLLESLAQNRPQTFLRMVQNMAPDQCLYGLSTGVMTDGSVIILKDKPGNRRTKTKLVQKRLVDYGFVKKPKFTQKSLHHYFKVKAKTVQANQQ